MFPASRKRILAEVSADARVLDVGGWAKPLARADCVLDMMPFETRGLYGERDPEPERFDESTWTRRDICDHTPWPYADDEFDFAVCSHTLEDVRDPIWVCAELSRVAKAGYVEFPSRLEEQSMGVHGAGWAGWSHHHWLIDSTDEGLEFVFKPHVLHANPAFHFPPAFGAALEPAERVTCVFWTGALRAREVIFTDADGLDGYLESFVEANRHLCDGRTVEVTRSGRVRSAVGRLRRRGAT